MPAARPDLETPHGRLQYARDHAGYDQKAFAALLGYSPTGWGKIERGEHALTCEHLKKANAILNIDARYFLGQITYEEAQKGVRPDYSVLLDKLNRLEKQFVPPKDIDPLAYRVTIDQDLRAIVETLAYEEGTLKKRIYDKIVAWLDGFKEGVNDTERAEKVG